MKTLDPTHPAPPLVGLWLRVEDGTLSMLREDRFVALTDAELWELAPRR